MTGFWNRLRKREAEDPFKPTTDFLAKNPPEHVKIETPLVAEAMMALEDDPGLYYMSFATDDAFLGAAIVEARGPATAVVNAHKLGCNPGGGVLTFKLPDGHMDAKWLNRVLTVEEAENLPEPKPL